MDSEQSIHSYVLSQLTARKRTWPTIAAETEIAYPTLGKIARGEIADPGVKKIERLAKYFRLLELQDAERGAQQAREATA